MTPRDFCYWLQGYFELGEMDDRLIFELSFEQTQSVINHLKLVHECNPKLDIKDKCNSFMYVLKGFFESHTAANANFTLRGEDLEFVRDTLEDIFAHVIDPTHGTPEQQAELKKIHDGNPHLDPAKNPGGLMRC